MIRIFKMQIRQIIPFFCLSVIACLALPINAQINAQTINGHWEGTITQEQGPLGSTFDFEMNIIRKGDEIIGSSYEKAGDFFVKMDFKGKIKSNVLLLFEDIKITHHQTPKGINWCIKKGQLILKIEDGVLKLEGFWQGHTDFGVCSPGKIYLRKILPRA